MTIDEEKYLKEKDNIIKFILENEEVYKQIGIKGLIAFLHSDFLLLDESIAQNFVLSELLSKFKVFKDEYDDYIRFYNILEKNNFIKGNCLEIGSGPYPRLAEVIKENHPKKNYNLTIYEPKKIISIANNITVNRKKFTKDTNIEKFDSIWGIYPCEASIDMTLKGIEENKNLAIAFCGCNHSTPEFPRWFGDFWATDFCCEMKERYGDDIEIVEWKQVKKKKKLPVLIHRKKNF